MCDLNLKTLLADLREELADELSAVQREFDSVYARTGGGEVEDEDEKLALGVRLQPDAASELSELAVRLAQLEVRLCRRTMLSEALLCDSTLLYSRAPTHPLVASTPGPCPLPGFISGL